MVAVVFDFDGTLFQLHATAPELEELRTALRDLFATVGIARTFRPLYVHLNEAFAFVDVVFPDERKALQDQVTRVLSVYESKCADRSQPCRHAIRALELAVRHWRAGIVSNNTGSCISQTFQRHGCADLLSRIPVVAFEDTERWKPDPAGLEEMLGRLAAGTKEPILYVGDHISDLEACARCLATRKANLISVCVGGGKSPWSELQSHPSFQLQYAVANPSYLEDRIADLAERLA